MSVAWVAHEPHHQSEDFNFSVGLRQGPMQVFIARVFYLPLAMIGFHPVMTTVAILINTSYQVLLHTELVGKLSLFERVLNTPSHHRVHHGINPRYVDKNFGGMLIIWDRMFGTFAEEREPPVYGTFEQVASFNPIYCVWSPLRDVIERASSAPRSVDELRVWIKPTDWRPKSMAKANTQVRLDRPKYDVKLSRGATLYLIAMTGITIAMTMLNFYSNDIERRPLMTQLAFIAWTAVSLVGLGGVIEGRAWARHVEALRLVATPLVVMSLL